MSLHIIVVHFPLALLVVGAAADVFGAVLRNEKLRLWAGDLLILGSLAALVAFLTGAGALSAAMPIPQSTYPLVETHSQWGGAAIWPVVGAGALRVLWRRQLQGVHGWATLAAGLVAAALILGISTSGLAIAHG